MNTIEIKQGDTLELACRLQAGGEPVDITGWSIASQVRAPGGNLVHAFVAAITAPALGEYRLPASAEQTATWPAGGLSMDIRYTDPSGRVMSTQTVPLQVQPAVTQG